MEQTQEQEVAVVAKTRIELPTEQMTRVKSASGGVSFHCGDVVAQKLSGLSLAHVKELCTTGFGFDVNKYDHLNPGQQRMTLGNLIRTVLRKNPETQPDFEKVADQIRAANAEEVAANEEAAAKITAEKLAKKEAAAAAKAEKAEKAAAKKEAAAKAKADKIANKDGNAAAAAQAKADKEAKKAADKQARIDKAAADKAAKATAKAKEKADKAAAEAAELQRRGSEMAAAADKLNAESKAKQEAKGDETGQTHDGE